ncbi:MAG: hypothetical protein AAGF99_10395 [Bacteroidota bacterium]
MVRLALLFAAFALAPHAVLSPSALAQGALEFMAIPPASTLTAVGDAGVGLPSAEPQAFIYNPAQLTAADESHVTLGVVAPTNWLPALSADLAFSSFAIAANLAPEKTGLPVRLGVGLARGKFDLGPQEYRGEANEFLGSFDAFESYWALGVGAGFDLPIPIHLGFNLRRFTSRLTIDEDLNLLDAHALTLDLGVLAQVPVAQLAKWRSFDNTTGIVFDLAAGYSITGLGSTIRYEALGQTSEAYIHRRVRLGWSTLLGYDLDPGGGVLRVVAFTAAFQAERALLRDEEAGTYASPIVSPLGALLGSGEPTTFDPESSDLFPGNVAEWGHTGRRGGRLTVLEAVSYSRGQFDGDSFVCRDDCTTSGLTVSVGGLLRAYGSLYGRADLYRLGTHYDVTFIRTEHPFSEAFYGVTLRTALR